MPFMPVLPCAGILFNFVLVCQLDSITWVYFGSMMAVGILIYCTYGFRNSKMQLKEQ